MLLIDRRPFSIDIIHAEIIKFFIVSLFFFLFKRKENNNFNIIKLISNRIDGELTTKY